MRTTKTILLGCSGLLTCLAALCTRAETGVQAWVQRYSHPMGSWDSAQKLATDSAGAVIVAGHTYDGRITSGDTLVIKYSGAGVSLWTNRYNGPGNTDDWASAVAVDRNGNVYVTVHSSSRRFTSDFATIAYSSSGVPVWTNRFGYGQPTAMVVDGSGNVFVTGSSAAGDGSTRDYVTIKYSGTGVPSWTNRYNGPGNSDDQASAVVVDGNGNVFVTGSSASTNGSSYNCDYATIKYSSSGVPLWTNRYNGPGNSDDQASAVVVDGNGNVFVTGTSAGSGGDADYATIAYSGAGLALWTNRYNGTGNTNDQATAMAVDDRGNVFVTGHSAGSGGDADYATIAYSGAGLALWTNRYNGTGNTNDQATAMAVDGSGNVFVTGHSAGSGSSADYATIAYSSAGLQLWINRYNGPGNSDDQASALVVDGSGNVFVTGSSAGSDSSADYATIAYSSAGLPFWTNRYNAPGNDDDRATAVAVDGSGNVFVTGSSASAVSGGSPDYATISYSGAGLPLWTNRYNGPGNGSDQPTAMAVDLNGNVFVTGTSAGSDLSLDYATIKYSGAGLPLWTNRYNGPGNGFNQPTAMAVDLNGNVFVTGYSASSDGYYDYATIAYSGTGLPLWTNRYNGQGGDNRATAVAVDGNGNVFVTGNSAGSGGYGDYATIKYSAAGVLLWVRRYGLGGLWDGASALAVDSNGNVFVTGFAAGAGTYAVYATIKYSAGGVPLWTNLYNGPGNSGDRATAVAVDGSGNVLVTGYSAGSDLSIDYATIKYSAAGLPLWTNRYNGLGNSYDAPTAMAVDGHGNVFVTGLSLGSDLPFDYATIKYSAGGVPLWTNLYNGPGNSEDRATAVAVDGSGNVFVTGTSGSSSDFATIKYISVPVLTLEGDRAGGFFISVSGVPNVTYRLQRAPFVTGAWSDLATNTAPASGLIEYHDTSPLAGQAFYRAVQP